jgi:dihydroxyacetone kinase
MGGGGGGGYIPPAKPRWLQDTSNEIVVSKYELSEKNKAKNARIRASLIRRPTIQIDNGGGDDHSPTYSGSSGWDGNASGQSSAGGSINDAMSSAASAQSGGGLTGTDFDGGSNKGSGFDGGFAI